MNICTLTFIKYFIESFSASWYNVHKHIILKIKRREAPTYHVIRGLTMQSNKIHCNGIYCMESVPLSHVTTISISAIPTISEVEALREYVRKMLTVTKYGDNMAIIDLRNVEYHGGTTLSSGYLPKWDIEDVFIKACSLHESTGQWRMDSMYESYAMDLFAYTGVRIAQTVPAYVELYNTELRKDEVLLCTIAIKFSSELTYYRDLRTTFKYGSQNDEILDFIDGFPKVKIDFLNMLAVDYIMNQTDRHSKNFGVLSTGVFAPLYDNGYALYYSENDERLQFIRNDEVARTKFLSQDALPTLQRYCEWLGAKPNIDFGIVLSNLNTIDEKYHGVIGVCRLRHNRKIIEERVAICKEILN